MRSGVLSLVVFLAVAVPTAGLVVLSWQWLSSQEQQRIEQRRDGQLRAVEATRARIGVVVDTLFDREELVPWTSSFHLMQPVEGTAVSGTDRASKWPTIVRGRFVVDRDGSVCAPSAVPVPELAEEVGPLRRVAEQLAERVEQSLGEALRAARRLADGPESLRSVSTESHRCSEVDALLRSVAPGEAPVLGCDPGAVVTVEVEAPTMVTAPLGADDAIAIYRAVRVREYGTFLAGALLEPDRLLRLVVQPPEGEIALEKEPMVRAGTGWAVVGVFGIDPRLPAYSIVLRDVVPTPIETAGRTWRGLFAGFCLVLTLVLTASIWAMRRFIAGTILLQREREHFVAAVTHELRTPLAAIRLFAELLQGAESVRADAAASEFVEHILDEDARLESLIENVLAITAIEHSAQPVTPVRGDLGAAIEAMLATRRTYLARRGVDLEVRIEAEMPDIEFDRLAVERITSNLLENAVKYGVTPDSRSIEITVSFDGSHAEIRVADRGPGLGEAGGEGIFRRFSRSATHRASSTSGVGLGLAIVSELTQLQGGQVSARNRDGGGAVFSVRLPA